MYGKFYPDFQVLFQSDTDLLEALQLTLESIKDWIGYELYFIDYADRAFFETPQDIISMEGVNGEVQVFSSEPGSFSVEDAVQKVGEKNERWVMITGTTEECPHQVITIPPLKGKQKSLLWEGPTPERGATSSGEKAQYARLESFQANLFEKVVGETNPLYAECGIQDGIAIQYCSEPYRFCSLPDRYLAAMDTRDITVENPPRTFEKNTLLRAVYTKESTIEIEEAKEKLTKDELASLLGKKVQKSGALGKGWAVWRNRQFMSSPKPQDALGQLFPTYIIRKRLREKGARLFFGTTESELLSGLRLIPLTLADAGIITKTTAELFESKKQELDIPFEKNWNYSLKKLNEATLKLLSKEEKHELGLDLPELKEEPE